MRLSRKGPLTTWRKKSVRKRRMDRAVRPLKWRKKRRRRMMMKGKKRTGMEMHHDFLSVSNRIAFLEK